MWFAHRGRTWEGIYKATHTLKWPTWGENLQKKIRKAAGNQIIKSVSPQMMQGWTGLMCSLLRNNEGNLIIESYQFLTVRLHLIREMSGDSPVSYPDSVDKAVADINSTICKSRERAFSLTCSNDLLICYAGAMDKKENSEQTRRMIWKCLTEQIYRHRDDLINSYWTYAVQRSALFLHDNKNQAYHKSYIEFHLVLGAHLLFHKRDHLLSEMLFRSQTFPPEYTLIPSKFSEVFGWFLNVCQSPYEDRFYFESNYPFLGDQDPLSSGIVRRYLRKYIALLMLRLKYVQSFYVHDDVSAFNCDFEKNPRGIQRYIDVLDTLKKEVDEWRAQGERCERLLENRPTEGGMVDVIKVLNDYDKYLRAQAQIIKENQNYSTKIITSYKQTIAELLDERIGEYQLFLDSSTEVPPANPSFDPYLNDASSKGIYPSSCFMEGQKVSVSGFDTAVAQQVYMALQHHIATFFFAQRILKSVYAGDVLKALDRLNPHPDRHLILCFGYNGYLTSKLEQAKHYKEVPIYMFSGSPAVDTFVVVIDKNRLPKIQLEKPQLDTIKLFHYEGISQSYPIYWSLTDLNVDSELKTQVLDGNQIEASSLKDKSYLSIYLSYRLYIPEDCVMDGFQLVSPYSSKVNEVDKLTELKIL
jgi:hypothetical protein